MSRPEDEIEKNLLGEDGDQRGEPPPGEENPRSQLPPSLRNLPKGISVLLIGPDMPLSFTDGRMGRVPNIPPDAFFVNPPFDERVPFDELFSQPGRMPDPPPPSPLTDLLMDVLRSRLAQVGAQLPPGPDVGQAPPPRPSNPLIDAISTVMRRRAQARVQSTMGTMGTFLRVVEAFDQCWGCLIGKVGKDPETLTSLFSLVMGKGAVLATILGFPKEKFMLMADTAFDICQEEVNRGSRPAGPEAPETVG